MGSNCIEDWVKSVPLRMQCRIQILIDRNVSKMGSSLFNKQEQAKCGIRNGAVLAC